MGLDIGSHSIKAVQMVRSGGRMVVEEAGYSLVDRNRLNTDPVEAQANALRDAVRNMVPAQACVVAGLQGQTVVIRYPRLPDTARDQLDEVVEREAGHNIPYDLAEVYLDWTLLDEIEEGGQKQLKVLLVAAKHEVIDARVQIFDAAEIQCAVMGVDSLALADAAESCDLLRIGETVAMVNIGLSSASVHFVKDGVSNFIRDINWGAREMIQALAKEYRCDYEEAERRLIELAEGDGRAAAKQAPAPAAQAPKTVEADPFGDTTAPTASLLDPLDDEEQGSRPAAGGDVFGSMGAKEPREILGVPLARLVAELRRSFDYYEHQLYERPVDRIILSGGVASLPLISEKLMDELGVEAVEVANPAESSLLLGEERSVMELRKHPARFMVAIGLAARGMAEI